MKLRILMALIAVALCGMCAGDAGAHRRSGRHEVWIMDQSNSTPDGGGKLHVFQGSDLAGARASRAVPEVIDLGGAARDLALAQTGSPPARPHMIAFNHAHTHAVIACVASGHVLFLDTRTRWPVGVVDVGVQAHAAHPSEDDSFVLVADQNGKKLHRVLTDYHTNTYTLDAAATIDLANGITPSGAPRQDPLLRPDNAPICPDFDDTGRFAFVTLRGGGMFVVDALATPMAIVGEYDRQTIHPNGCGGALTRGKIYLNAGGGTPANPLESDLYAFRLPAFSSTPNPPNTPAPRVVFSHDDRTFTDAHGITLVGTRYLWVADRAANLVTVVDTIKDREVHEFSLAGKLSADPAPDLIEASPSGNRVYVALRGPNPLTANVPGVNNAVGSTPGLGVIRVMKDGARGVMQAVVPISNIVDGVERADPHGIAVRRFDDHH